MPNPQKFWRIFHNVYIPFYKNSSKRSGYNISLLNTKVLKFDPVEATHVRLVAKAGHGGFASAAEFQSRAREACLLWALLDLSMCAIFLTGLLNLWLYLQGSSCTAQRVAQLCQRHDAVNADHIKL